MAQSGDFHHKKFDFQEDYLIHEASESIDDVIDKKIFKYKYRIANDTDQDYFRRMDRVVKRFLERAKSRDPAIHQNLAALFEKSKIEESNQALLLSLIDGSEVPDVAKEGT